MFLNRQNAPRILLIDDDSSQISLLNKVLKDLGKVYFEQHGMRAHEKALLTKPDIILLDIEMPDLSGYQVLEQLKSAPETESIPVIFITSHDSKEEQLECLEQGAVDFIVKPLVPEVVAARVKTHLKLSSREKELIEISRHARVTLECIGDAVITTDNEGRVTYMNPSAELMTGVRLSEASGLEIEEVMPLRIGDQGPPHINPIYIAIQERREVGMAFNCQMLNRSGHWVAVEDSAAPLISEDDEVLGAVIVFMDINESRAMALKMSHTLQYDHLTNLPNRFLMMERIRTEMGNCQFNQKQLGLVLIDIDRFKLINEEFGFEYGDALLKKIAQNIQRRIEPSHSISRHNADQFMLLVPDIDDLNDLARFALNTKEKILQLVSLYPELTNFAISIGMSLYPDDSETPETLVMHADAALYRAKTDPSHEGIAFYGEDVESQFVTRRERYGQLKHAISTDNFKVDYQPIVDSKTMKTQAVEALVRIFDTEGNVVSPLDFIGLAEETKLIIPLGEKVILTAFGQLREWNQNGFSPRLCINISPVQFLDPHFIPFLLKTVDEFGLPSRQIELEVTETLMLNNKEQVSRDLAQLKHQGFSISIDDFGTGYSSLSYLKDFPVDTLKIDRSFISQISEDSNKKDLVTAITSMAASMGLNTIAEGVETESQLHRLQQLNVSLIQGFLFSQPVPPTSIAKGYELL